MSDETNGDLQEVEVEVNGVPTTLLLNAEDAKQYAEQKKAEAATKKATASNK